MRLSQVGFFVCCSSLYTVDPRLRKVILHFRCLKKSIHDEIWFGTHSEDLFLLVSLNNIFL